VSKRNAAIWCKLRVIFFIAQRSSGQAWRGRYLTGSGSSLTAPTRWNAARFAYSWEKQIMIRILLGLVLLVLLVVGGFGLYVWGALKVSYSSGERSGYVQKLSKKGWVCKTWEGEMAMVTMPGVAPEIFYFSVRDDGVAQKINNLMGKRVAISYGQHKGVPTKCFGETEYHITDVRPVE
jgi:hypothetical protein